MPECKQTFSLLVKHNMNYVVYLLLGFPEETEEDILQTIEYAKTSTASALVLSVFTPYPGCESYEKAKELGMLDKKLDWSRHSHQSLENYFCKNIEREKFFQLVQQLAEIVDNHNIKMKSFHQAYFRKIKYYSSHPTFFIERIKQKLNR